ncbi:hypothetical protein EDF57_10994 [Novosphingobium sp. PhB55]|uniref:PRC-barrel domain containing protein n=1 Tax=Novosphingobium sp. PhB55 TaxID=2485106 RepID=UPI0010DC583A|nr:PRC-barrel domain containing protein [Novosphingobium sp. PhB55]TDW61536.1 hypothetical protein EDF57_10994 [Novosphingobium sp. PhB55]
MEDLAAWVDPAATMIAAMMTAANLGARITGLGFVVLTVGSLAWSAVGLSTSQANLMVTNGFLTLVNLVGIWRWLSRRRAYEDGGKSATSAGERSAYPALLTASGIAEMPVVTREGDPIGKTVHALLTCNDARVSYVVIASDFLGGIGEELRTVGKRELAFTYEKFQLRQPRADFERLPQLRDEVWPSSTNDLEFKDDL